MADEKSLCRVDWKLGQALMPEHFLWQEDSLRSEWELRFAQQSLPMWGVANVAWDEKLLKKTGCLLVQRLQLVFETGLMVDVPGNAQPVSMQLPQPEGSSLDVYVHLDSASEVAKGGWGDDEGSLVELRMQRLRLSIEQEKTPLPGFRLMRLTPSGSSAPGAPRTKATGWELDRGYLPPIIGVHAFPGFAEGRMGLLVRMLEQWKSLLRSQAVASSLGVHKRVEANLYLRRATGLAWRLLQSGATLTPPKDGERVDRRPIPAVGLHPFEFFRHLTELYLDVHAFRRGPLQTLSRDEPVLVRYEHERIADCLAEVEEALRQELERPGAGSPQWAFKRDAQDPKRLVCRFPVALPADAELYFLVQFGPGPDEGTTDDGLDRRLLGMKLAAPSRLTTVESRVLPGIPLERVRLVPFPHDFDSTTVQFYRLRQGPEWTWALRETAIALRQGPRGLESTFLFSPDVPG